MGGSGVQLVGAVLADAGQDFSANGLVREVLVVVAVGFAAGLSTLSCRPQVASTRDSGRQTAKNTRLVTAMRLRASRRDAPPRLALLVSYRPLAFGLRATLRATAFRALC